MRGVRRLEILSIIVIAMVMTMTLAFIVPQIWVEAHPDSYTRYAVPNFDRIELGLGMFWIATTIPFGWWIHVAGTNAVARGHTHLRYTPGSRIWWYFVPIASIYKPFDAMRELWNASHDEAHYDKGSAIVTWWWLLWLGSGLSATLAGVADAGGNDGHILWAIDAAVAFGLGIAASLLVYRITAAQRRATPREIAEIFV